MTGEDKIIFVDTNILIYSNYSDSILKNQSRNKLQYFFQNNYDIWISRQIIREFLVYATRYNFEKDKIEISKLITSIFSNFEQYKIAEDSINSTNMLKKIIEKFDLSGKKIHDANIVATMLSNNISKLLTHNVKDFERFGNLIQIIPLIDVNN